MRIVLRGHFPTAFLIQAFTLLPKTKKFRRSFLNENSAKGTFSYGIPYPGVYIIAKDKKVQAKFFESDYTKRPSVDKLLAEIKKLNPPPVPQELSLDEMGTDPIDPNNATIDIPEKITDPIVVIDEGAAQDAMDTPVMPEVPAADTLPAPAVETPVIDVPELPGVSEGAPPAIEQIPPAPEAIAPEMEDMQLMDADGFGSPTAEDMPDAAMPPAM